MLTTRRLGILISGRGSNLQAIIDAIAAGRLDASIAIVISNRADAPGLERARGRRHPDAASAITGLRRRARTTIARSSPRCARTTSTLVCLAGFMRLLGAEFVAAFPSAVLNVHPVAAAGLSRRRRAAAGVGARREGDRRHRALRHRRARRRADRACSAPSTCSDDDTAESLSARILVVEHQIYPAAIARVLDGGWRIDGRRVSSKPLAGASVRANRVLRPVLRQHALVQRDAIDAPSSRCGGRNVASQRPIAACRRGSRLVCTRASVTCGV